MLNIVNNTAPSVLFNFEVDGEVNKLQITRFTVSDQFKLIELQSQFVEQGKKLKVSPEITSKLMISRIMVSVKTLDGKYFFTQSIDEVLELLSGEAAMAITAECDKLNPFIKGDLEERKK